jgi:hypothetical protein
LCQRLLRDTRLYALLLRCDRDLAEEVREAGCRCGGRLDSGHYPRKPRGGPPIPERLRKDDPDHSRRLSLCCAVCRRRTTPASVRFLGRRFYLAATVVLVSALRDGLTRHRVERLHELYDVSRRTLERWREWWLETFAKTDLWRAFRGRFAPPVDEGALPRSLLERFGGLTRRGLVATLRFLAPLGASEHARRGAISGPQRMKFDRRGGGL